MSAPVNRNTPALQLPAFLKGRLNLGVKLPLMIMGLLSLAFVAYTFLSIRATRATLINIVQNELSAQAESKAEIIRTNLVWARNVAIDLAASAETIGYDEATQLATLRNTLLKNEQVFGSTMAYEPYQFAPELYYWSPYYNRVTNAEPQFTQLGNPEYDYFNKDWYALAKQARQPLLSPPYFDRGGGEIWMVTWSVPFFDQQGSVRGVATADIAFSQVQKIVESIEVGREGYAFLLDSDGAILGISAKAGTNYTIMSDKMPEPDNNWGALIKEMRAGEKGVAEVTDPQGKAVLAVYTPVGLGTGWSLAMVFPESEIVEQASAPQNTLIFYATVTALVFGLLLYLLTLSITQPLRRLTEHAMQLSAEKLELTGGSLKRSIEINTRDEVQDLAEAFNQTAQNLAQAFENLEEKVADRSRHLERRSLELETIAEVAREINIIHDLNTLLTVAAQLIRERFKYYHVGIFLTDERGEFAVLRAASSVAADQMLEQNFKLRVGQEGLVGNVTRTGQAHIALDVGLDAIHFQNPLLPLTRSEITLPLRSRSVTIGALDIQAEIEAAFSEQDIKVLQLLADQLAAAIENAELVQQVEKTYAELDNAYRLQTQSVWKTTISEQEYSAYEYDGIQVRPVPRQLPNHLLGQLERGEPILFKEEGRHDGKEKNVLMVPLMLLNQVIGVIGLEREDPNHLWTDEEISIAQAAANRAGITLENARLLEESQRRALKERTIFAATERIGSAMNVANILHTTAEEIERLLGSAEVILQFNNDNASSTNEE
jgi:GAF domain-containing protein/HAMP domain-containing protein